MRCVMEALWTMGRNVLLFVALAIPGILLRKSGKVDEKASKTLSSVLLYAGMPFLVCKSVMEVEFTGELLVEALIATGLFAVMVLGLLFGGKWFAKKVMRLPEESVGVTADAIAFANNGFLGIPLIAAVFGSDSKVMFFIIFLNLANQIVLYTLGEVMVSGDKNRISLKGIVTNPALIAFCVGLIFNFLKVSTYVPEVMKYSTYLGNLVVPLSMMILGLNLGNYKLRTIFSMPRAYVVSAIRLIVVPVVAIGILFLIRPLICFYDELMIAYMLAMGMPVAAMVTTFASQFQKDTKSASVYTMLSAILSTVTIPVLYFLLTLVLKIV